MDSNPQSSDICQRLFRLVVGALRRPSALPPPSNSEIVVELRHTAASAKDCLILSDEQTKLVGNGGNKKEREKDHPPLGKGKGVKKSVSIMGSERKEVAIHSYDQSQDSDTKSRRHWPLLSVASNINEKTEAFIERKKKAMAMAMGRNYSLDQEQKK